jgi:flavin reductase (DIM6/NTAB) family NADH-FMN oxidoreductase RutF
VRSELGGDIVSAFSACAAGVTLVTIADGRDDIGTTVSTFCPVSLEPPLVLVSLIADSYPAEVLGAAGDGGEDWGRAAAAAAGADTGEDAAGRGADTGGGTDTAGGVQQAARFAVTILAAGQRMLAGRFAASGRPGARLLLDDVPHRRGTASGALIVEGGLAALECAVSQLIPAGDHLVVIAGVTGVAYVADSGDPLIRFRGRYPAPGKLPGTNQDPLAYFAALRRGPRYPSAKSLTQGGIAIFGDRSPRETGGNGPQKRPDPTPAAVFMVAPRPGCKHPSFVHTPAPHIARIGRDHGQSVYKVAASPRISPRYSIESAGD